MMSSIIAEDFDVTAAMRDHVDKSILDLVHFVPQASDDVTVHFFLRQEAERLFSATIRARFWGREFVATHRASDLYVAINLAKRHLVRRLNHIRGRRSALKRKRQDIPGEISPFS
jgi:ribosomal subunit interface protein